MRIVKEIEHPRLKITLFQNEGKYSIKFEKSQLEQIYKFRDLPIGVTADEISNAINNSIIEQVEQELDTMNARRAKWIFNLEGDELEFPEII